LALAGAAAATSLRAEPGEAELARPRSVEGPAQPTLPTSPAPPPQAPPHAGAEVGEAPEAPPRTEDPPRRGLWVLCEGSQRVLERREGLAALLEDADALGVTDLFVQVYRGGRAWFPSLLADDAPHAALWREDGRDALAVLVEQAHRQGLRVHAWVNVLSLSSNADAPILRDLGRDAAVVDQKGRSILDYPSFDLPPPDRSYYRMGTPAVWLDPAVPGVAPRLAATFAELLTAYPELDGLHLDYVRYADVLPFIPGLRFGVGLSFGFGEPARARFQAETGLVAPFREVIAHGNRFDDWRREKLTELVAEVAQRARAARPGIQVSAAVVSDRARAYLVDFQHWAGWLDEGLLDFAVPMLYTLDHELLRHGVEELAGLGRRRALWVGLGSWLFASDAQGAVSQLRAVTQEPALGTALFSWDSIHDAPALRDALAAEVRGAADDPPR
jgi:uncharacterized lipoprotein YddW (UPF0748 family)